MAGQLTPREQLERLFDLVRRATHYFWLAGAVAVVGTGLALALALGRPHQYESETVLLYRELISQSVLQGREVAQRSNQLSARYKEMLLARSTLIEVIHKFELFPGVVANQGEAAAADLLRVRVGFRDKGAGTFRISYRGDTPKEAQAVTEYLAEKLREKDAILRREQAEVTKSFLEEEKRGADQQLSERERALAEFLAQHPEFAEESGGGATSGAGIRALQNKKSTPEGGEPQLSALLRQKRRIQDRLANPDKPVTVRGSGTKSPERLAAEANVKQAQREVDEATRDLQSKLSQFTEKHPDVVAARSALSDAQKRLRQTEAELPPLEEEDVALPVDRESLEQQLKKVDAEIAWYRTKKAGTGEVKGSGVADDVVGLETEWAQRMRQVDEARERVASLESRVFTAEINASSEFADAAQLAVVDPAFLPHRPAGQSRKMLVIAGGLLFCGLGAALALGLALIDDRVYRRSDLERLDLGPVLVVVPRPKKRRRRIRG